MVYHMERPAATPYGCLSNEHEPVIPDRTLGGLKWYLRLNGKPSSEVALLASKLFSDLRKSRVPGRRSMQVSLS
jgi:hypothetical protein